MPPTGINPQDSSRLTRTQERRAAELTRRRNSGTLVAKRRTNSKPKTRKDNPTTPLLFSFVSQKKNKTQKKTRGHKPTLFDEIRRVYREKTGGTLSDAGIGRLVGTKHQRRNVYGFRHAGALLLFLESTNFKAILTPYPYLLDIASHPSTMEQWLKKYRERVELEKSRIGNVLGDVMEKIDMKREIAKRDKTIGELERELERLRGNK